MGSCCSKRHRRSDSRTVAHATSAALHPSLDNWKVHNIRPSLSEIDADVSSGVGSDHIPVMWAKPTLKPPFSFPSIHYNINSNLLCDSNLSSSRSLGTSRHHVKSPVQPQAISRCASKLSNEDGLPAIVNQHMISSLHHEMGRVASARHHDLPHSEPDKEAFPAFSFATQPYIEPDFFNSATFAFHPATQSARLSTSTNNDCIKLQVRHKHMFPEDFKALQSSFECAMPPEGPSMRRSRSVGKLPEASQEVESQRMQHHRRSFHETAARVRHDMHNIHMSRPGRMIAQPSKASDMCLAGGDSSLKLVTQAFTITDMDDDYSNDEDNDNFLDINVAVDMNHAGSCWMCHDKEGKDGDLDDTLQCTSLHGSASVSKSLSMEGVHESGHASRISKGTRRMNDEEGSMSTDFEFKQPACKGMYEESAQFAWDYDWQRRHQATPQEHEDDDANTKQQLSIVSTGDAVLLSGSDSEEFHLIPSRYVSHDLPSPLTSPIVSLSPLKLIMNTSHHRSNNMSFSVEDIMLLLENEDMSEDDLLSLLINSKSSPSRSTEESLPMSVTSSSPALTFSSASSLASSSSSSSSSSPRPWFPCPSTASPGGSSSKSLMSAMPRLSSFSSVRSRSSSPPSSVSRHYPSPRRMSPHPSFEFKVKSYNSAASTPMFSPIRASTKRNIAHLKPTALTTEEIAEIWGVFEQRQQALVGQRH